MTDSIVSAPVSPQAIEQAAISFSTISGLARTVSQLCVEVIGALPYGDPARDAHAVAARDLTAQIGLLADIGAKSLGKGYLVARGTDPADWLQPPIYREAAEGVRHD